MSSRAEDNAKIHGSPRPGRRLLHGNFLPPLSIRVWGHTGLGSGSYQEPSILDCVPNRFPSLALVSAGGAKIPGQGERRVGGIESLDRNKRGQKVGGCDLIRVIHQ